MEIVVRASSGGSSCAQQVDFYYTHNFRYVCTDRESSVTFPNTNKRNSETGEQREEGVVQNLDRWLVKPFNNSIQHTLEHYKNTT